MKEFLSLILGIQPMYWYGAAFFFAALGLFLCWAWFTKKGIKNNPETPDKFSWSFWIENNLSPKLIIVATTLIVVFISLRFAPEIFNTAPTMFFAFLIGIGIDRVITVVKKLAEKFGQKPIE